MDGIPYELYHWGVFFVAALLGEILRAAVDGLGEVEDALGPALDLLIWIPKTDAPRGPSGLRPLQLPTCLRRLFGAIVTSLVGPCLEPHLSPEQTALRGGDMGQNVRDVFAHLGTSVAAGTDLVWSAMWEALLP